VFEVQAEIAARVAQALNVALGDSTQQKTSAGLDVVTSRLSCRETLLLEKQSTSAAQAC
jgi:hypothetical protein